MVLSLFISIIMDTYEIIKNCYERGFPPNRLEQFYCTSQFDFRYSSLLSLHFTSGTGRVEFHTLFNGEWRGGPLKKGFI